MNMWMILFMLLPIVALTYIGWHIWCLLPLGWIWKTLIIVFMTGAFLLLFAGFKRVTDDMPMPLASMVYEVGTSSIFILLYLFMLFVLLDLGRLVHLIPRTVLYQNWWTAGGIVAFIFCLFLYGNLHYQSKKREAMVIQSDKVTSPVKIVLMSDLHLGYHNQRDELRRWVDLINAEQPDIILMAGDIIDGSMRPLKEQRMHEEFHRLQAPVYACLGNHEYYSGEADARQFYHDAGIHLLSDSIVMAGDLCIIGRDDRTNPHRQSLGALLARQPSAVAQHYAILLDHQPYHLEQAERQGIDFQFSGHTHHGQVWPISWITDAVYECAFGHHQRGKTRYYISSGMGIWGGKFRIGTRSEYLVIEIRNRHADRHIYSDLSVSSHVAPGCSHGHCRSTGGDCWPFHSRPGRLRSC